MAIFAVHPGRSYHAVQEVYTERSPRLSIQGWYHAAAPPPGADMASLSQLKAGPDGAGPGPDPVAEARFAALAGVERRPDPGAPPAAEGAEGAAKRLAAGGRLGAPNAEGDWAEPQLRGRCRKPAATRASRPPSAACEG